MPNGSLDGWSVKSAKVGAVAYVAPVVRLIQIVEINAPVTALYV